MRTVKTVRSPGATVPRVRDLMRASPFPEHTLTGDGKIDRPGWYVSYFWTDQRFVDLHFAYWYDNRWDGEREATGLAMLRTMCAWVADQGFVVYLVPDVVDRRGGPPPWEVGPHHPYALVGRVGNYPRAWKSRRDEAQAERFDPEGVR